MNFQPRYVAYAKANNMTPDQMLKKEKYMMNFMIWINLKWIEWEEAAERSTTFRNEQDHEDFDKWLTR